METKTAKSRLSELASLRPGRSFRTSVEHDPEGDCWVLRPGDIDEDGEVSTDQMRKVAGLDPKDRYLVDESVVLFITYGANNRAYCFDHLPENTVADSKFTMIRPEGQGGPSLFPEAVLPEYLAWYMNREPAQAFYEAFRRGSTTTRISRESLGRLEVPVPPEETQREIAETSRLVQKERELLTRWVEKRSELAHGLMLRQIGEDY